MSEFDSKEQKIKTLNRMVFNLQTKLKKDKENHKQLIAEFYNIKSERDKFSTVIKNLVYVNSDVCACDYCLDDANFVNSVRHGRQLKKKMREIKRKYARRLNDAYCVIADMKDTIDAQMDVMRIIQFDGKNETKKDFESTADVIVEFRVK